MDANQGFPIVIASEKAIYITELAVFNGTNTQAATMRFGIVPAGTERIGGTPHYEMAQIDFFPLGNLTADTTASTQTEALVAVGIPVKGQFSYIVVPPGGILVAYPSVALNGTMLQTAIGWQHA